MPSSNKNLIRLLSDLWESMAVDGSRDENCNQSCGASGAIPCLLAWLVGDPDAPGRATPHIGNPPYGDTGTMLNGWWPWPLSGTSETPPHAAGLPLALPARDCAPRRGPAGPRKRPGRLSP